MEGSRLNWCVLLVVGIAYFPFLLASQYVHPLGIHEWDFISASMWDPASLSWWERQVYWYQQNGGRYTSTAIFSVMSAWYSLTAFRTVVLITLLFIPITLIVVLDRLLESGFGLLCGGVIWLLYLHQLTNIYDSLLRFTAHPVYHLGIIMIAGLALLLYWLCQQQFQSKRYTLLAIALAVFVVGTSELSIVHLFLLLMCTGLGYYQTHGLLPINFWLIMVAGIFGSTVALAAPGNFARMQLYTVSEQWFTVVPLTLATSAFLIVDWLLDTLLIPVTLLLLAIRYWFFSSTTFALLTRPWLLGGGLLVLCPLSLFPLLYATGGSSLPERLIDLLFLLFAVLFIFTSLSIYQYYIPAEEVRRTTVSQKIMITSLAVFVTGRLFFEGLTIDRSPELRDQSPVKMVQVDANIGIAYRQLIEGIPQQYDQEMRRVVQKVRTCKTDTCWVPRLTVPHFIGYDPLYDRMSRYGERGMAQYLNGGSPSIIFYSPD